MELTFKNRENHDSESDPDNSNKT